MGRPFLSTTCCTAAVSSSPKQTSKNIDEPAPWRDFSFDIDSEEFVASAVWEWWIEDAHGVLGGPTPVHPIDAQGDDALVLLAAEESDDTDSASDGNAADDSERADPLFLTANNEDGWTEVNRAAPLLEDDPAHAILNPTHPDESDDEQPPLHWPAAPGWDRGSHYSLIDR